jgi:hypothetical protein
MEKYYDKNGVEIKEGMTIRHNDGDEEKVHANSDGTDLGVSANKYEIYPLYQFDLKREWEIVKHQ